MIHTQSPFTYSYQLEEEILKQGKLKRKIQIIEYDISICKKKRKITLLNIDKLSNEDKIIASEKMIPDIIDSFNIKKDKYINLEPELLQYIVFSKVSKEDDVKQLRKCLEKLFNKINNLLLTGKYKSKEELNVTYEIKLNSVFIETVHITKKFIDSCLESLNEDTCYSHMYI